MDTTTDSVSENDMSRTPAIRFNPPLIVLVSIAFLIVVTIVGTWMYNEVILQKPLDKVLLGDSRNQVIQASAHFDGWVDFDTVVFDLRKISGEATQVDVFRVFLQFARALKDHRLDRVVLSAFGTKKFFISGDYFRQLGEEYDEQNPIYTVRTFAHHLFEMDGSTPFPEPSGGLFWVLGEEMKQFTEFNKKWYLNDFASRQR